MQSTGLYEGICDLPIIPTDPTFRTKYFPSVIVFTLAVGWYYLNGLFYAGGTTALFALIPFFFTMVLAGIQAFIISKQPNCPPIPWWGYAGAFAIGILSGTIGYWGAYGAYSSMGGAILTPINVTAKPTGGTSAFTNYAEGFALGSNGPITIFSNPTKPPPSTLADTSESGGPSQCAAPTDQTYMVDLYKNGKLVSTAVTERS